MFGWIPAVLVLFMLLPVRQAIVTAMVTGWLFLPVASFAFKGIPNYDKISALSLSLVLGVAIFDHTRIWKYQFHWSDMGIVIWCVTPFFSSMLNGLGVYDGLSHILENVITWGGLYLIGRLYFTDAQGLKELAMGFVIGALIYIPFCLYEMRMSPQLHRIVYGYHPHAFVHSLRGGGFRPMVFLGDGLVVGIWMASAAIVALVFWWNGTVKRLFGMPMVFYVAVLFGFTLLCKSKGALLLLVMGTLLFFSTYAMKTRGFFAIVLLAIPLYLGARIGLQWDGRELMDMASLIVNEQRIGSLETRLSNEHLVVQEKISQPLFGWGGWGRNRIQDETGNDISITDSLWMIVFGKNGVVGLTAVFAVLMLPVVLILWRLPINHFGEAYAGPAVALCLVLWAFTVDRLLNAQPNPIYIMIAGGLVSYAIQLAKRSPVKQYVIAKQYSADAVG